MKVQLKFALAVLAVVLIAASSPGPSMAADSQRHVLGESEIMARIDQQVGQADADRQAIRIMLQREDVRRIAGSAGLDLERASAAAAVLSGSALENLAAQAREINASIAGGDATVVVSATAIIIILLIILILR